MTHRGHVLALVAAMGCASPRSTPPDVIDQPRALASRIAQAHGVSGAPGFAAIRYEHELDFGEVPVWRSIETVELALPNRTRQDWPLHGAAVGWDGDAVWTTDWSLDNPPEMMPFLSYFGLTVPLWIAAPDTRFGELGRGTLPGDETEYLTLMAYPPRRDVMPPSAGHYRVFVDPVSAEVRGVAYTISYRPMLDLMQVPADVAEMGPMTHVIDDTTRVGGLTLPARYHTIGPSGGVAGVHVVRGWATLATFDSALVIPPRGATRMVPR